MDAPSRTSGVLFAAGMESCRWACELVNLDPSAIMAATVSHEVKPAGSPEVCFGARLGTTAGCSPKEGGINELSALAPVDDVGLMLRERSASRPGNFRCPPVAPAPLVGVEPGIVPRARGDPPRDIPSIAPSRASPKGRRASRSSRWGRQRFERSDGFLRFLDCCFIVGCPPNFAYNHARSINLPIVAQARRYRSRPELTTKTGSSRPCEKRQLQKASMPFRVGIRTGYVVYSHSHEGKRNASNSRSTPTAGAGALPWCPAFEWTE